MQKALFLLTLTLTIIACRPPGSAVSRYPADTAQTDTTVTDTIPREPGQLLSAFYGLDNELPDGSDQGLCEGAEGADGMPVIFSAEVDVTTLQAGDFRVVSESGAIGEVYCVTLFPAVDIGELRTALLVGELGSATDDPPVQVEIVGHVYSLDNSLNFYGATITVTPLLPGPTLVLAESVPEVQWELGKEAGLVRGSGSGCPVGTTQIVRVVWAGGVVTDEGEEPGEAERLLYEVTLTDSTGNPSLVTPYALGDLGDGDNNHLLCLDVAGTPTSVSFPAGHLVDPNLDLNPATTIDVSVVP